MLFPVQMNTNLKYTTLLQCNSFPCITHKSTPRPSLFSPLSSQRFTSPTVNSTPKKLSLLGLFTANGHSRRLSFDQCHSWKVSLSSNSFSSPFALLRHPRHRHHRQGKAIMKSISIPLTSILNTNLGYRHLI